MGVNFSFLTLLNKQTYRNTQIKFGLNFNPALKNPVI